MRKARSGVEGYDWEVVGKKGTRTKVPVPKLITSEDIFKNNADSVSNITEYLTLVIAEQLKNTSSDDAIGVLGNIGSFVLSNISSKLNTVTEEEKTKTDDQKMVIKLSRYIEKTENIVNIINVGIDNLDNVHKSIKEKRNRAINNIKSFLVTCGINEIKNKNNDTCHPKSYKDAFGVNLSELVVDRPLHKRETLNRKCYNGSVNITIASSASARDLGNLSIKYMEWVGVFGVVINKTVYTAGPGNFVNLKNSNVKTTNAKRCLNVHPCRYKNCKYYHDPVTNRKKYSNSRNFAISYVSQLLSNIKDSDDLLNNKTVRDIGFLRDLVQLGGIILIKAAEINELYFNNVKK